LTQVSQYLSMTVAPSTLKKAVCVATFPHPTQKYVFIAFFVLSLSEDGGIGSKDVAFLWVISIICKN
jgi:hypothetical protein